MCLLLAVQALSKNSRKWHVCTILYAYTRKGSFCLKKKNCLFAWISGCWVWIMVF